MGGVYVLHSLLHLECPLCRRVLALIGLDNIENMCQDAPHIQGMGPSMVLNLRPTANRRRVSTKNLCGEAPTQRYVPHQALPQLLPFNNLGLSYTAFVTTRGFRNYHPCLNP